MLELFVNSSHAILHTTRPGDMMPSSSKHVTLTHPSSTIPHEEEFGEAQ